MSEVDISLPISFLQTYAPICSIITGGGYWGSTGYQIYKVNNSKIRLRFINHFNTFADITSAWFVIGF